MSEKYKFHNEDGIYFITPSIVNWIDLFTRQTYSELVLDSLRYCQKEKGLIIHAWCIIPSHLHNNPVEHDIVFRAEDYVFSSAIDYCGEQGLLKIDMIE